MNTKKKILIILSSIFLIGAVVFVFNYSFLKKIEILDCEATYTVEKPEPGFLDVSEGNAKVEVALCLCEKYDINKETIYKNEILKLYDEPFGGFRLLFKNPEKNVDSICKYRNDVFTKMYNL
ncbi:hypothetical protein [Frigoriflavimonas asaccharolytica]|uniref:Uncharacterized protein n=1 Tax=Frigoriflavimonas asaccharolytica TaxID=2735899 RepID=A0A8J8G7V0_9FLAO|nr:hypothetical protein [Frigoriflavimonas asaccharolytica]NRS91124.1 hypothetical protein [Frigoriflavimonas asaccharolytica]